MKYGQQLEQDSVPEWSLHNLDYNTLKHEIKVHTTRDQATAITIPGQQDAGLQKFEDGLYLELCRQHDRVGMFVRSKADEINRRLTHLSSSMEKWISKFQSDASDLEHQATPSTREILKGQRKSAKYQRELMRVGDDISALSRFASAQVVAFRKIMKKYKKWTGSTTLGARFTDTVLSSPKSFTRLDLTPLRNRSESILSRLRVSTPQFSEPSSPSSVERSATDMPSPETQGTLASSDLRPQSTSKRSRLSNLELPSPAPLGMPTKYWNEYDNGSEGEGPEDEYAIYIDPEENRAFPGLGYVHAVITLPYEKAKAWFQGSKQKQDHFEEGERERLLHTSDSNLAYASTVVNTDSEEEGYASSDELPTAGYAAHYAFPSLGEQRRLRYREKVLFWGTIASFAVSFVLVGICSILISTGRHKLMVEVDAGVTLGVMLSLVCSCSALGMTLHRNDTPSWSCMLMVWGTFMTSCLLNGMLLILVVGNRPS